MRMRRRLTDRDLGDGTIMSRVDTLEHAVAALTRVQVCSRCPVLCSRWFWVASLRQQLALAYALIVVCRSLLSLPQRSGPRSPAAALAAA